MANETTEEQSSSPPSPSSAYGPLVTTAVIGAILYTVDALVLGQGGLIVLATMCGMIVGLVRIGSAVGRRSARDAGIAAMTLVLWIGFAVGTFASVYGQTHLAKSRAERVIAACEAYRTAHGVYPENLQQLVPGYLPEIPRARIALTFDRFDYITMVGRDGAQPILMYTTVPPFGHASYTFETKRWSSSN